MGEIKAIKEYHDAIDVGMLNAEGLEGYAKCSSLHVPYLLAELTALRAKLALAEKVIKEARYHVAILARHCPCHICKAIAELEGGK